MVMQLGAPSWFWMRMECSGVSSMRLPSTGEEKVTPCSVMSARCSKDTICAQAAAPLLGSAHRCSLPATAYKAADPQTDAVIGCKSAIQAQTRHACSLPRNVVRLQHLLLLPQHDSHGAPSHDLVGSLWHPGCPACSGSPSRAKVDMQLARDLKLSPKTQAMRHLKASRVCERAALPVAEAWHAAGTQFMACR